MRMKNTSGVGTCKMLDNLWMREKLYELQETQPWGDGELFCEELTKKRVKEYCKAFPGLWQRKLIPGYFSNTVWYLLYCGTSLVSRMVSIKMVDQDLRQYYDYQDYDYAVFSCLELNKLTHNRQNTRRSREAHSWICYWDSRHSRWIFEILERIWPHCTKVNGAQNHQQGWERFVLLDWTSLCSSKINIAKVDNHGCCVPWTIDTDLARYYSSWTTCI